MLVLLIVCYIILQRTCLGRHIYAVGGNAEAAKFAGINIVKTGVIVYTISGVLATFTGIFLTARMYTGQPTLGASMVNDAIAATVVGGTSMAGGKGRIVGTLIGAMLIGIIGNGMNLLGLSSYLQDIAKGLIILGAVYIDAISTKRIRAVGITGQMHGIVLLDKEKKPLLPVIIWADKRSRKQVEMLKNCGNIAVSFERRRLGQGNDRKVSY